MLLHDELLAAARAVVARAETYGASDDSALLRLRCAVQHATIDELAHRVACQESTILDQEAQLVRLHDELALTRAALQDAERARKAAIAAAVPPVNGAHAAAVARGDV